MNRENIIEDEWKKKMCSLYLIGLAHTISGFIGNMPYLDGNTGSLRVRSL